MRVLNPINSPFEFLQFLGKDSNILSVVLPTFIDVVFLSPEYSVCSLYYRNHGLMDHGPNAFYLVPTTQETAVHKQNDLVGA